MNISTLVSLRCYFTVAHGLTLLPAPGGQSSSLTPKALGPAFFPFFIRLMPHVALGGLLSSNKKSVVTDTVNESLLCCAGMHAD